MAEESISVPITPETVISDEVCSRSSEGKPIASRTRSTKLDPRRASTGSLRNGRKFSSGKSSSPSGGESPIPNYLRASTGSCHDFCKYGKKHETEVKPWQARARKVISPTLNQKNSLETGASSEKKITKTINSKPPPASKNNSRSPSAASENKVSSTSNELAVNYKKKKFTEKKIISVFSGRKESEIKPVKTKGGTSKEPMRKLVSSPVAYIATKPSFNRDLGLKFIANTSKKIASPLKDQNKVAKFGNKHPIKDSVKDKSLNIIKADAKKTVPESRENKHEGVKEVHYELIENKKINFESKKKEGTCDSPPTELSSSPSLSYDEEEAEDDSKQKENTKNISPSESFVSLNISSSVVSPALSYGKEETTDEIEYNDSERNFPESEQNESTNDSLSSELFPSPNISSPVKSPVFSGEEAQDEIEYTNNEKNVFESEQNGITNDYLPSESLLSLNILAPVTSPSLSSGEEEAQDEIEYSDNETDGSDESIKSDDEEISVEKYKSETRKAKVVSEESETATKLKFKRGKVVDIEAKNSGPRRLKFRKARILDENNDDDAKNRRRSFQKGGNIDDIDGTNDDSEKVVLRHQQMEDKKDAKGLFNNVIEETANKLVETRKSKVKALVGAFETVISLQDIKPTTPTVP